MELQNQMVQLQQEHNFQLQDLLGKHSTLEMTHKSTSTQLNLSRSENENLKVTIFIHQESKFSLVDYPISNSTNRNS
jgi:hypothetical protein